MLKYLLVASLSLTITTHESVATESKSTIGVASYYWQSKKTANGEYFNPSNLTAAHPSLPFGTMVKVTNLANGKSVVVRINDRGPFKNGRVIDVSKGAAQQLDMIKKGLTRVALDLAPAKTALQTAPVAPKPAAAPQQPSEKPLSMATADPTAIVLPTLQSYITNIFGIGPRADLSKATPRMLTFLEKVQVECGAVTAISGYRHNSRVAGTKRVSLHASGRAIDYQVANPPCALKVAKGYPFGHSTDYYAVKPNHFHFSDAPSSSEWNRRFVHYKPKVAKKQYAKRFLKKRYAKKGKYRYVLKYRKNRSG